MTNGTARARIAETGTYDLPLSRNWQGDSALKDDPQSNALAARVEREQAENLVANNQPFSLSGLLLALAFGAIFYGSLRDPIVLIWLAGMNATQVGRLIYARRMATRLKSVDPIKVARHLCIGTAVTSAGWGLAPWLFFPEGNITLICLMMTVLLGMVSAGIASVATYRPAVYSLVVPALTGLGTALASHGDTASLFLAACAFAYILVSLTFGIQQHQLLELATRTRLEKEDLAERLAEQVRVVEQASLEKTRFFASASHDLRQPLHSIGLFGTTLRMALAGTSNATNAENLMQCDESLEVSFSSMLDVSKLDAGVVEVRPRAVPVVDVFRRLQQVFSRQAEAKGLGLRFTPGDRWILVDPALFERLVGNLVHNALKFTQAGGVAIMARRRGDRVSIEIWDTGSGIASAEFPRVFDEFYQLGNRERDRAKGLGMGLAIVRRLAALMQCPLRVRSTPGRGTVFSLLVPAVAPEFSSRPAPVLIQDPSPIGLAGLRILVIDDEEAVRSGTAAALGQLGVEVEVAADNAIALELAARAEQDGQPFDVVVTDFRLRGEDDGIKLASRLRRHLARPIPILLVTGETSPEQLKLARASGLRTLYKPVRVADLIVAIRQAIEPA